MKKVGYNTKGLRICLDRAIPKDEEIQGRENQMVTREELRTKVFFSFIHVLLFSTSLLAARDMFWDKIICYIYFVFTWPFWLYFQKYFPPDQQRDSINPQKNWPYA